MAGLFFVKKTNINIKIMLRIALQAKGRLNEDSANLIQEAGITLQSSKRLLLTKSPNFPIEVLYLRDDDIPNAVANNVADIGIVGLNEVKEKQANVKLLEYLGFGNCRISLAIPKHIEYTGLSWFEGKRIATSYPNILKDYFAKKEINVDIEYIAGSVEIAPAVNIADAIFDIVSSGGTLISNGLNEVETVMSSEAVLISSQNLSDEKQKIVDKLLFRINSVERSKGKKYLLLNVKNESINKVLDIMPSMRSPTLLPLAQSGWSSIHSVVSENDIWDKIEILKSIGAEDILVLSLEKMII